MNLLIHNVRIFTNDDTKGVLDCGEVAILDGKIEEIGIDLQKKYPHLKHFDGRGRLLMPGLINTHMHFYSTYARGIPFSASPANFCEILRELWWKLDSALDLEAIYYSTLVPAITAIKKGVTAFIDHHASPRAVEGSLDQVEKGLNRLGLRGILCYEISDRDGREIGRAGLEENRRYIDKCQKAKAQNPHHHFDGMVGLHASFTVDDSTLEESAGLGQDLGRGWHFHLLEDGADGEISLKKYGKRPVQRMGHFGLLGEKTLAAHAIHLTEKEKDLLAQSGSMVVHNPRSNMNNAVGASDILGYFRRGCLVGLGTDGMSASLVPEISTSLYLQKHQHGDSNLAWEESRVMALQNNPQIYERLSGCKIGRLKKGYLADVILVDYYPPTPLTAENFWGHFLYGIASAEVDTVWVGGKIVMEKKQIPGLDEQELAHRSCEVAKRVWEKFSG